MIDWSLPPDLQQLYDRVVAKNKQLQEQFGIKSMTIAERAEHYRLKREISEKLQKEAVKMRPRPNWKV